jgi:hypothetical protein
MSTGRLDQRQVGAMHGHQSGRSNNQGGQGRGRGGGNRGRGGRHKWNRGRGGGRNAGRGQAYIPREVLETLDPQQRQWMIKGRNLQQAEDSKPKAQNTNRNASAAASTNPPVADDTTTNESTIRTERSVQFDAEEDGGASGLFGYNGQKKQRNVSGVKTINRRIGKAIKVGKPSNYNIRARAEIDTRADTVCAGSTFILYESTNKVVDVSGFHDAMEPKKNIQIGTCITALDLRNETIIASFPQSLYFGNTMETSLIPPAQLWNYGLTVYVVPK